MVFSAEFFGAELVAVVVGGPGVGVVGSVVDEQLAINTATHAASAATLSRRTLQERGLSSRVLGRYCAWESIIVASTASNMGFAYRADHGYTLGRRRTARRTLARFRQARSAFE